MITSLTPNMMTESVEETIAFYVENLGFQEYDSATDENGKKVFVILGKDKATIMFQLKESLSAEYPVLATEQIKPMLTLYFVVDNFDEYYAQITKNVPVMKEIHITPYGAKEFAILDNNNIVLTVAEDQ
jgi:hypothetical protein